MVISGLEKLISKIPEEIKGKKAGILCHSPSITRDFKHISDHFHLNPDLKLAAIFGPQHGIHGQTQDNMIEWEGYNDPYYKVPVFSLYGSARKPTPKMLDNVEVFIIDLQDVGARLYTYAWTMKHCMEACSEAGIPVYVTDRPNPVAPLGTDGPVLKPEYFTFVGGAEIPLCHSMTMGEIALWLKTFHVPGCQLKVIKMDGWNRSMFFSDTSLPWVLPSPNMPALTTAIVYPGMVLAEALNLSEGRGTTLPFEIFGAPYIRSRELSNSLNKRNIKGCTFRVHDFIPTFNKYSGELCCGFQMHVTDRSIFRPVEAAIELFDAIIETSGANSLKFNPPPYEYEYTLMPFDILAGDSLTREALEKRIPLKQEFERWSEENRDFKVKFREFSLYS